MKPSLTDTLCTRCGLCCDGSLFADVELSGKAEATRLEILGLEVEDDDADGGLISQPCAALQRRKCSIYAHRPKCCRAFECQVLRDVRRGAISVEQAGAHIAEVLVQIRSAKVLLTQLGQCDLRLPLNERAAEALGGEAGTDQGTTQKRTELAAAMSTIEKMIRTRFLGGKGTRGATDAR